VTTGQRRRGIACAGNWIVDQVYVASRWPAKGDLARVGRPAVGVGGGAANVLTDLASLGASFPLAAVGCVGDDDNGRFIAAHCARLGLRDVRLTILKDVATANTLVLTVPGDSRTFFYHGGANDAFAAKHFPVAALADAGYRILYLGYLMLLGELDRREADGRTGAARALQAARAAGMLTCVDCVSDPRPDFAAAVAPALPQCDYLILNEVEAGRAAEIAVRDRDDVLNREALASAAARLIAKGVKVAVVVHAPEGALWTPRVGESTWRASQPLRAADIVSPVGAGDAFCAAILYGLHEDWPVETILRIAHGAAAACLGGTTATDGVPPMTALLASVETPA
jgi:sugar/nucleoside kinase (ribokinase family)